MAKKKKKVASKKKSKAAAKKPKARPPKATKPRDTGAKAWPISNTGGTSDVDEICRQRIGCTCDCCMQGYHDAAMRDRAIQDFQSYVGFGR